MELKLKHRFFLALVLLLIALAVFACSRQSSESQTNPDDGNLDITVVVMKRDVKINGPMILGGPITSDRYNVTMPSDSTVKELKSIVFQLTGLAHFEQKKIVYKGMELNNSETLQHYNVTDGSRIHVFTEYVI